MSASVVDPRLKNLFDIRVIGSGAYEGSVGGLLRHDNGLVTFLILEEWERAALGLEKSLIRLDCSGEPLKNGVYEALVACDYKK